jgi:hypothetical protein
LNVIYFSTVDDNSFVLQMHVFLIESDTNLVGEIRAPIGRGTKNFVVMENVCVRAKPNCRVEEWSPKLFLIKALPDEGDVPEGTTKRHLFQAKTCKRKPIVQTPEELELKFDALKKTVGLASNMRQFDIDDKRWWATFWEQRLNMPEIGEISAPPDPLMIERTKKLFWGTPEPDTFTVREEEEREVIVTSLKDLASLVNPRTEPGGHNEFGRDRKIGYLFVSDGVDVDEATQAAVRLRSQTRDAAVQNYFETLKESRGPTEEEFLKKIKVCFLLIQFLHIQYANIFFVSSFCVAGWFSARA